VKDLVAAVKAAVVTKPPVKGTSRVKGKGKRRKETFDTAGTEAERAASETTKTEKAGWGLLEPLRSTLDPILSLFPTPSISQLVIGLLLVLLVRSWFFTGRGASTLGLPLSASDRLAAYEQMWQREENELWDWLEDRVGFDAALNSPLSQQTKDTRGRQKVMRSNSMGRRLADQKMSERQVDDAIRVTEERLDALKDAVERKKGRAGTI